MHSSSIRTIAGLLLILAGISARAEAPPDCAHIESDRDRLACYDRTFGTSFKPDAAVEKPRTRTHAEEQQEFGRVKERSPVESITSDIVAVRAERDGRFVVELANGQTWTQSELQSQAHVSKGDSVTIRRGLLGSFLLVTRDGIATRVKRSH